MLRMVYIQLMNVWRKNVWIFVELLCVFCLLWYVMDYLFVLSYNRSLPSHRSLAHTWLVDVGELPETHPDYRASEADSLQAEANYFRLLDRVREVHGVVAMAVSDNYSKPGSGYYYGRELMLETDTTKRVGGQYVQHDPYRGDLFSVFRHTDTDGKPVSVKDFNWDVPGAVVVGQSVADRISTDGQVAGLCLVDVGGGSSTERMIVQGVVGDTKRFDFLRPQKVFYQAIRADGGNWREMLISVRSSEELSDAEFAEAFKAEAGRALRVGNFYLRGFRSYESIHAETAEMFGQTGTVRIYTAGLLFFLLNIMLCVMGTFWYRIQQRRGEIGLRMAMGSTRAGIRSMFMLEGLCLLTLVVLPAMVIEGQFVYLGLIDTLGGHEQAGKGSYLPDRTLLRFLLTNGLTWVVLAVAICLSVWVPAGRASKIAPAEALHGE